MQENCRLGEVEVVKREEYGGLEVDSKVEMIRALVLGVFLESLLPSVHDILSIDRANVLHANLDGLAQVEDFLRTRGPFFEVETGHIHVDLEDGSLPDP